MTKENKLKAGSPCDRLMMAKTQLNRKNGIMIFNINKAPIKKGLNIVVNRYTDDREKLLTDAMFPIPKNDMLMNSRKKLAILKSVEAKFLKIS